MRSTTEVDAAVGRKMRETRALLGWSQEDLAGRLGLSFQQIQKYESGANRIGASRLYEIARLLDRDVNFFFEGYPMADGRGVSSRGGAARSSPRRGVAELRERGERLGDSLALDSRELLVLVRTYRRIREPHLRRSLMQMVRSFAENSDALERKRASGGARSKPSQRRARKGVRKTGRKRV